MVSEKVEITSLWIIKKGQPKTVEIDLGLEICVKQKGGKMEDGRRAWIKAGDRQRQGVSGEHKQFK